MNHSRDLKGWLRGYGLPTIDTPDLADTIQPVTVVDDVSKLSNDPTGFGAYYHDIPAGGANTYSGITVLPGPRGSIIEHVGAFETGACLFGACESSSFPLNIGVTTLASGLPNAKTTAHVVQWGYWAAAARPYPASPAAGLLSINTEPLPSLPLLLPSGYRLWLQHYLANTRLRLCVWLRDLA